MEEERKEGEELEVPLIKSHRLVGERRSSALREDEESRILDPARCIRVFESRAFELFLPPTWPPPKTDSLLTTNRRFSRPISRSLSIYFNYTPVIIINYRVSIHVRYRNPLASARSSQPASQTDQASLSTTNYAGRNNLGESLRVLGWAVVASVDWSRIEPLLRFREKSLNGVPRMPRRHGMFCIIRAKDLLKLLFIITRYVYPFRVLFSIFNISRLYTIAFMNSFWIAF